MIVLTLSVWSERNRGTLYNGAFPLPLGGGDALMLCECGGVGVGYGLSAMSLGHGGC